MQTLSLTTYQENKTQEKRVLDFLREARGSWVDGMVFLRMSPPITQFHARIWGLQQKGYNIEGRFIEGKSWKEYRLTEELAQARLI